jgi:hypothetical protein
VGATTLVSGTLTGAVHWVPAGSPYQLTGNTTVAAGATLTVDPGVRVEAAGPYTLTVLGAFSVPGLAKNPVIFTSTGTTPGSWGGVYLGSGATATLTSANFLLATNDVTIDGAQATCTDCRFTRAAQDGVEVYDQAQFTATGCTFGGNGRRGLYAETVYPQGAVSGCTFSNNGEYPVFLKANCVGMLGTGLVFNGNKQERIGVSTSASKDLTRTQTWRAQPVPLDLTADGSGDALTIPAGVTLTLQAPLTLLCPAIEVAGALHCGQPGAALVTLDGPTVTPGSWPGVDVQAGATAAFHSARVRYAATGVTAASATFTATDSEFSHAQFDGINATDSRVTLSGCLLQNNGRYGLRLTGAASGSLAGTRFLGNGDYALFAEARNVALLGAENRYWGNGNQRIGVACGAHPDLTGAAVWTDQGIPYDLTARPATPTLTLGSAATLTLRPGATVLGGSVAVYGTLLAEGSAARPVQFLPASGTTPGSWVGLTFYAGAGGRLGHCLVDLAQTGVTLVSASPAVRSCTISHCLSAALSCQGTAAPVVYGCVISDNAGDGVTTSGTAAPDLGHLGNSTTADDGHNVFTGNGGYDLRNLSSAALLAQGNYWGTGSSSAIAAWIYDGKDAAGLGIVTYVPYVTPAAHAAPVLAWTGGTGYVTGGVQPLSGTPQQTYAFRVKYTSAAGHDPACVRLYLQAGAAAYPGSPFSLTRLSGASAPAGYVYGVSLKLQAGRAYSYQFVAADALLPATGPPTAATPGPVVNTPPTLAWVGGPMYSSTGVSPTSGAVGATYTFRVRYRDANNDPPVSLLLYLEAAGVSVAGSPFSLGWQAGTMNGGAVYQQILVLPAGSYRYRFTANDGLADATGPPTIWQTGPQVGSGTALALSVAAVPPGGGRVSLRCRLSQAAALMVRARNLAGRLVATVVAGLPCAAGESVLVWNRRSDQGTLLPPGTYLLEITARAPGGQAARQVVTVRLP